MLLCADSPQIGQREHFENPFPNLIPRLPRADNVKSHPKDTHLINYVTTSFSVNVTSACSASLVTFKFVIVCDWKGTFA